MAKRIVVVVATVLAFSLTTLLPVFAQGQNPIQLPAPKLDPAKSLAQALKDRKTTRKYSTQDLSQKQVSNLLWAAFGVNRPKTGRRTAPSARNWQDIDIYVSTAAGTYLYDAKANALVPVVSGDIRPLTYIQATFKDAPLNLVYVSDLQRMTMGDEPSKMILAAMDMGFVAQNVYLYCASEGLDTGFRVSIDKAKLGKALKLRPTQKILGAQSVGLPPK